MYINVHVNRVPLKYYNKVQIQRKKKQKKRFNLTDFNDLHEDSCILTKLFMTEDYVLRDTKFETENK